MREPRHDRSVSRAPFDPREERVVDGLARWMGVLGRFQVLAGGVLLLSVLGIAIAYATTGSASPAAASDTTPPLVQLGEVPFEAIVAIAIGIVAIGVILLRGGVLLTDAAEDLERVIHTDDPDQHHLENALRRLRAYFRMEILLVAATLASVVYWAVPGWS